MLLGIKSIHTYSISLSYLKRIIKQHFISAYRYKVHFYALRKISDNLQRDCDIIKEYTITKEGGLRNEHCDM